MLSSIIGVILVLVFGGVMVYFARLQGHSEFLMAIGSFIFILYLVVKDMITKIKAKRENSEKAKAKRKKKTGDIAGIAHMSTKDKK